MRKILLAALAAIALVCPRGAKAEQSFYTPQGLTQQANITATGTPPDANSVCLFTHGLASLTIATTGTWVGTIQFWYMANGTAFALLPVGKIGGAGPLTGTTGNATFFAPVVGYAQVCATASAWTSGTAVVLLEGSQHHLSPEQKSTLNFAVNSTPAVSTQATASQASGGAGVRHVGTRCSGSISTIAAQTNITLNLRNGASGAGTVVWAETIICPINTPCVLDSGPVLTVGSAATAMTCEWNAAPVATNFAVANLSGYDIP